MTTRKLKWRLLSHGGDRRTGDALKATQQLTARECRMLILAAYEAWERGQPFNRFITLLWEKGGVDPRDNGKATRQFLKHAGGWLRSFDCQLLHCWVQEYGLVNGAHVHILLHIPPMLDPLFSRKPMHWAKLCLPGGYVAKTVDTQRVAPWADPDSGADAYEAELMAKLHYMLKCAPVTLESDLGMAVRRSPWSKSWGQSGVVFGKRAGRWQDRKLA